MDWHNTLSSILSYYWTWHNSLPVLQVRMGRPLPRTTEHGIIPYQCCSTYGRPCTAEHGITPYQYCNSTVDPLPHTVQWNGRPLTVQNGQIVQLLKVSYILKIPSCILDSKVYGWNYFLNLISGLWHHIISQTWMTHWCNSHNAREFLLAILMLVAVGSLLSTQGLLRFCIKHIIIIFS